MNDKLKHYEKRLDRYGLKWEKNEYGQSYFSRRLGV